MGLNRSYRKPKAYQTFSLQSAQILVTPPSGICPFKIKSREPTTCFQGIPHSLCLIISSLYQKMNSGTFLIFYEDHPLLLRSLLHPERGSLRDRSSVYRDYLLKKVMLYWIGMLSKRTSTSRKTRASIWLT